MPNKLNLLGLAAGISTFVLIAISLYVPWWQFTVGKPTLAQLNFSPLNLNLSLLGKSITMPLIWAINLATTLTLAAGGIVMLIYSVKPNKSYSKQLLGFGWKKPLYAVIFFVIEVVGVITVANMFAGLNLPINGSAALQPPQGMLPGGMNFSVDVLAAFQWPFYLAIVVAALCVAARIYHRKISVEAAVPPPPPQ